MPSWFFSLQFRMAFAFALVLGLALLGVSLYVGYTAKQATIQFERDVEEAKAARIEQLISDYYAATSGWGGLQPAVEHASSLYGVNIVVKDASGDVIADSRLASSGGSARANDGEAQPSRPDQRQRGRLCGPRAQHNPPGGP